MLEFNGGVNKSDDTRSKLRRKKKKELSSFDTTGCDIYCPAYVPCDMAGFAPMRTTAPASLLEAIIVIGLRGDERRCGCQLIDEKARL